MACGGAFRHNLWKWFVGLPVAATIAVVLFYATRESIVSPFFLAFFAVPALTMLVLSRIPNYIVTRPPDSKPVIERQEK